jgi:sensor domain CHASE-containing protein
VAWGTALLLSSSVRIVKSHTAVIHRLRTAAVTDKMKTALQDAADSHTAALSDLSRSLEAAPPRNDDEYRELAVRAAAQGPAFMAVNFLDHRFIEKFLFPYGPNRALQGMDLKTRADALPIAHRALTSRRPAATDLVPLVQGGEGFLEYTPVFADNRWEGLVEGALDRDAFAGRYVLPATPEGHDVTILSESSDRPFFDSGRGGEAVRGPYDFYFTLRFGDRRWWVVLHPRRAPSPLAPLVGVMLLELGLGSLLAYRIIEKG